MLDKIKFLTAGESHGKALVGIIDGIPSGLEIGSDYIQMHMAHRQLGYGRGGRMKIEDDLVEIVSGIRYGKTIGSPISLVIDNKDWINWKDKMSTDRPSEPAASVTLPRPGHADLAGVIKNDLDDIRNVLERASARETAMRVALSTFPRKMIEDLGILVTGAVTQVGNAMLDSGEHENLTINQIYDMTSKSKVRCVSENLEKDMISEIDKCKMSGDSIGGTFEIYCDGLPYGLGSYGQWDRKLQSKLSEMVMSINGIKAIEIGAGSQMKNKTGSSVHDEIGWDGKKYTRSSNRAGGIEGGMSNAQRLVVRAIMKPLSTLSRPLKSVDIESKEPKDAHKERTDTCVVPAASVIAENLVSLVIADAILSKFGGDSIKQLHNHYNTSARF